MVSVAGKDDREAKMMIGIKTIFYLYIFLIKKEKISERRTFDTRVCNHQAASSFDDVKQPL